MFRRFRFLVGLFAIVVVTAIAGGSAYFYFGGSKKDDATIENKVETSEDGNNISADNIFENYEFGADKNLNETYTYYFFPSTLYMELYNNGYSEPEKVFGYNEVVLDDSGDPVLTSDGQPTYEINQSGISGVNGNSTFYTYYDYLKNSLNRNPNYYLFSDGVNRNYDLSNNPEIFSFGDSIGGKDYYVYGNNLELNDIYSANNSNFITLVDNFDIENRDIYNYRDGGYDYGPYYYTLTDKKEFNLNTEVLSPITKDNTDKYSSVFDIDLSLENNGDAKSKNYSKADILEIYFNYYQEKTKRVSGDDNRILTIKANFSLDYDYGPAGYVHYENLDRNDVSYHLPFYIYQSNGDYEIGVYTKSEIDAKSYLGTWVISSGNSYSHLVVLTDDNRGLLVQANDEVDAFTYKVNGNTINIPHDDDVSGTITLSYDDWQDNFMNRAQYRNDRFGFWTSFYDWDDPNNKDYYIENSASRYLPIKITVNGNLTPDDMAKVIPSVSTSTFDSHLWFDYTSNVWTYTKGTEVTPEYTTAVGGFTAKDITNVFDIMQNPSKYADNNVIRLYPVFSNGKNYVGTKDDDESNDYQQRANGGSDGIRAEFNYTSTASSTIKNSLLPTETKFTYAGGTGNNYKYGSYDLNYAILKNLELVKGRYQSIDIKITTTPSPGSRGSNWSLIYSLSGTAIDDFVERYGAGLYTIYLFIGGRATNTDQGKTPFLGVNIIDLVTNNQSTANDLKDKHLMSIYDDDGEMSVGTGNNGVKYATGDGVVDQRRPVLLTIEKVTNFRLVTDIPIKEENGKPSNNQNWGEIDESVHQGLLHAENFLMADEIYEINEKQYNSDGTTFDDISGNFRLDTNNPYIYVIQNADFRFVNNLYFQIRFSNDYINDALDVHTDYQDYANSAQKPPQYVAYNVGGQLLKFKFQDSSEEEGLFIDNVGPISGTNNKSRNGFKLKDYNSRGIYDILLVSRNEGASGTSIKHTLNMYINRHTNSFIKLFKGNPGTFEYKDPEVIDSTFGTDFVRHKLPSEDDTAEDGQSRVKSSTLLWNGHTYLGEYLATNTSGIAYTRGESDEEEKESGPSTFFEAVKNCLGITPGNDLIYPIIDAVTGRAIAYYNSGVGRIFTDSGSTGGGDNSSIDLFNIMKNYVLYIPVV